MNTLLKRPKIVPPLETGDRLSVAEFRRRYERMPDVKKAELIRGVVYMASPVSLENHATPHSDLVTWIGIFKTYTPGTQSGDNATIRDLADDSEPQPDVTLHIVSGGTSTSKRGYLVGPPELVAEISATTVSQDLHDKLDLYREAGVREYIVWRVLDRAIDWFVLRDDEYVPMKPTAGVYKSETFPGLWLNASAMIAGDMVAVLDTLHKGIDSPEHRKFVKLLKSGSV